ncbi:MAG: DsbA family protein [Gemmatimonadaceae bacterium]|jgi:protein-disulfide isomerase|nr:DsbA family protein [Gemmatimonadaceae bacterium]
MSSTRLDRAATIAVIVAAIAVCINQLRPGPTVTSDPPTIGGAPRVIDAWQDVRRDAIRESGPSSGVVLIEFADFECPFCARFHQAFASLATAQGLEFEHAFVHFPLPMHRFAMPAARAAECAHAQQRFPEMKAELFGLQDSLGLIDWRDVARRSKVPDLDTFDRCIDDPRTDSLVHRRSRWADSLRIEGTPSVLIDSVLYSGLSADSVLRIVKAAIERRASK